MIEGIKERKGGGDNYNENFNLNRCEQQYLILTFKKYFCIILQTLKQKVQKSNFLKNCIGYIYIYVR